MSHDARDEMTMLAGFQVSPLVNILRRRRPLLVELVRLSRPAPSLTILSRQKCPVKNTAEIELRTDHRFRRRRIGLQGR